MYITYMCKDSGSFCYIYSLYIQTHTHICVEIMEILVTYLYNRVFTSGLGNQGSITSRIIPKTHKIILDTSLLNTGYYKVWIKGKWNNPEKPFLTLQYSSYWKGSHRITLDYGSYIYICIKISLLVQWKESKYFIFGINVFFYSYFMYLCTPTCFGHFCPLQVSLFWLLTKFNCSNQICA